MIIGVMSNPNRMDTPIETHRLITAQNRLVRGGILNSVLISLLELNLLILCNVVSWLFFSDFAPMEESYTYTPSPSVAWQELIQPFAKRSQVTSLCRS
jgi:hypothetical protein